MSHQEKKTYLELLGNVLVFTGYGLYVYLNNQARIEANPNDFAFWGSTFLIMIPVAIVIHIVLHILFAIYTRVASGEGIPDFEDEMDKLIELRAIRNSHWTFILGFGAAMASQVMGYEPFVMVLSLFGAGFVSSIVSDLTKLYFYRKGL